MSLFSGVASLSNSFPGGPMVAGATLNPTLALGLADTLQGAYFNYKNYQLQHQAFDWQKEMQYQAWGREDNSIARRVADLKASGLSPVLAAGSGASSSSPISVTPPQMQGVSLSDKALFVMQMLKMEADISKTLAEQDYIKLQAGKIPAEIMNLKASAFNTYHSGRNRKVEADVSTETGVPGSSIVGKTANDAYGAIKTAGETIKNAWNVYDSAVGEFRKKVTDKSRNFFKNNKNKK